MDKTVIKKAEEFLEIYSSLGTIGSACSEVGITRHQVNRWKEMGDFIVAYPTEDDLLPFPEAFINAKLDFEDYLEAKAIEWALVGIKEPLTYQGQFTYKRNPETLELLRHHNGEPVIETVHKRNSKLLERILEAKKPELYRNNYKVEHDIVAQGGVLVIPVEKNTSWEERAKENQKRFREKQPDVKEN